MTTDRVHWIIIGLLLAILFVTLFYGCKCRGAEGFKNDEEEFEEEGFEGADLGDLTPKERELFQSLVQDKLDDSQIMKMVQNNVITEKLVEKFLNKLADDGSLPKDVVETAKQGVADAKASMGALSDTNADPVRTKVEPFRPGPGEGSRKPKFAPY